MSIEDAPFKGVLPLAISSLKSASPVLRNQTNHGKAIALTPDQLKFGWANNSDDDEARELNGTFHVPASGAPLFRPRSQTSIHWGETRVDSKNPDRGPLLIIAGDADNTVPLPITEASSKIQSRNPGDTEIERTKGRGHSLVIDQGWQDVAETALAFVRRFV